MVRLYSAVLLRYLLAWGICDSPISLASSSVMERRLGFTVSPLSVLNRQPPLTPHHILRAQILLRFMWRPFGSHNQWSWVWISALLLVTYVILSTSLNFVGSAPLGTTQSTSQGELWRGNEAMSAGNDGCWHSILKMVGVVVMMTMALRKK